MRTIASAPLRLELLSGALHVARASLRRNRPSSDRRAAAAARPARMSSVGSRSSSRPSRPRGGSSHRPPAGPEVGRGGGHHQDVAWSRTRAPSAAVSSAAVSTSTRRTPGRRGKRDVGGDQGHLGAPPGRSLGEGQAHAAAGAVADEANGVDRLAGTAGGDQHAQAVPGTGRPRQHGLDLVEQARAARAGARRRARRARRAPPPRARSRSRRARAGWRGSSWVAGSRYMRSFIAGATRRGAEQARNEVVTIESAIPAASLAIVFAEAGAIR